MTHPPKLPVAALVVGYMPERSILDALISRLLTEVSVVVLLDNGGAADYLLEEPAKRAAVRYVNMGGNLGLGAALNRGMQEARGQGLRYVITFDQDSSPPVGMVAELYWAMLECQQTGRSPAAIGPAFFDQREEGVRCFPQYREIDNRIEVVPELPEGPVQEVDMLITSGMLVDSDVWHSGLKYDDRLVVDYTDTDWCFRVRAAGWRLWSLNRVRMPHSVSTAKPVRVLGVHLLRYSPLRRYYYFRNTAYFVRQSYVSTAWRRRLVAGMCLRLVSHVFIDKQRWRGLQMSLKGVWHGLRGRLGIAGGGDTMPLQ